jgi:hypothetical protein
MMRGRQKARVFPEPVNAMPIRSRPENLENQSLSAQDERKNGISTQWVCLVVGLG